MWHTPLSFSLSLPPTFISLLYSLSCLPPFFLRKREREKRSVFLVDIKKEFLFIINLWNVLETKEREKKNLISDEGQQKKELKIYYIIFSINSIFFLLKKGNKINKGKRLTREDMRRFFLPFFAWLVGWTTLLLFIWIKKRRRRYLITHISINQRLFKSFEKRTSKNNNNNVRPN